MRSLWFLIEVILLILFFSVIAKAIAIGITPSAHHIQAKPGESYTLEIIIDVRDSGKKIPIKLRCSEVDLTVTNENLLNFNLSQTSEQPTCSWVKFLEEKVVVEDTGKYMILRGKPIPADKYTTTIITLPKDVEPGYHLGHIDLIPEVEMGGRGFGIGIITSAASTYIIRVEGNAIRSIQTLNFLAQRVEENRIRLSTIVKNNGTVTVRVVVNDLKLIKGNETIFFPSASSYIKPGEIAYLLSDKIVDIEDGDYLVKANISWLTGSEYVEGKVRITPLPKIPVAKVVKPVKPPPFLLLASVLAVILILALIFYFKGKKRYYRGF